MGDNAVDDRPLAGLRVFELSIAIAAPTCGRYLAHFGADVIKVESRNNPDIIRLFASAWLTPAAYGMEIWGESSPYTNDFLAGKRSVGLDLKHPQGLEAAKRLLAGCDVFLSNYSAPAVRDLGLDFESVRAVNPRIVYAVLPGFGTDESTPYYPFLAWGPNQAPLVGLDELTGYADQAPAGIATISYPDYSSGLHAAIGVLAALEERDDSGEAQLVELSQFEATVSMLGPFLLDHALTGHSVGRAGNDVESGAPEGVYRCRGRDRWVAVSVTTDDEWHALCRVMGRGDWAADEELGTVGGRTLRRRELDNGMESWTAAHTNDEVASWLQAAGVAAASLLDAPGIASDRHLQDREFWLWADSLRFGKDIGTGNPIKLLGTPGYVTRMAPIAGEDTHTVLRDVCGYGDDEIEALAGAGAAFLPVRPDVRLQRPYLTWIATVMPSIDWSEVPR